jgi:hypothetical protein
VSCDRNVFLPAFHSLKAISTPLTICVHSHYYRRTILVIVNRVLRKVRSDLGDNNSSQCSTATTLNRTTCPVAESSHSVLATQGSNQQ